LDGTLMQEHNAKHVPELFIDIAGAMGIPGGGEDADQAISKVLDRIRCGCKKEEDMKGVGNCVCHILPRLDTCEISRRVETLQLPARDKQKRFSKSLAARELWHRSLSKEVGIPPNLKVLGAKPHDFATLATNAMKDACAFSNPVEISHEDIVGLFQQAYDQE
jgi:alcohol dehydrogenase class IV